MKPMGLEKWKDIIKQTTVPDAEWEELTVSAPTQKLGPMILQNYLQKDGDVIEIDMTTKKRRALGVFLRALKVAAKNPKTEFLLRYSQDYKTAYIKRVG